MRRRLMLLTLVLGLGACALLPGSQTFVLFYKAWDATLDPGAMDTVNDAVTYAKAHPLAPITVTGFADPVGSTQDNIEISKKRVQVVVDALLKAGIDKTRISTKAVGETKFIDNSQESRRVNITVGTL